MSVSPESRIMIYIVGVGMLRLRAYGGNEVALAIRGMKSAKTSQYDQGIFVITGNTMAITPNTTIYQSY